MDHDWNGIVMQEKWLSVVGFAGLYEVSDLGRIRSLPRNSTRGQIMTGQKNLAGYFVVNLCKCGRGYHKQIHRLVLESFVGLCPDGMECCHKDDDKSNNILFNLRWDTHRNNIKESFVNGRIAHRGSKNGRAKLIEAQVVQIRTLWLSGRRGQCGRRWSLEDLSKKFTVSKSTISMITNNRCWKYIQRSKNGNE